MSLKHQLLAALYPLLKARNLIANQSGRLRVLLYHDIPPLQEAPFAAQLRWLSKSWRFVSPDQFLEMLLGDEPVKTDSLMLTFDDGFASNRKVAAEILNPMGIRALFFVVTEFVQLSDGDDWRGFVARNIFPSLTPENVPAHWRNMSWSDLAYLLESGHTIGGHTATHARLSRIDRPSLHDEIVSSANTLERKLGVPIDHFAYTFGDLGSFSPDALAVARSRFRCVYTGLRGNNAYSKVPWAIRRDAVQAFDSLALIGSLLEGGADRRYAKMIRTYLSWGGA